ncbi:MAG: ubiquinol-cytochrome C chaperone family protein [Pseudomonadota bacterium]
MLKSLFAKNPARERAMALYAAAVEQARLPVFYTDYGVEDTVEGRFELVGVHVFLMMRALKGDRPEAQKLSQALLDVMFENLDAALRELGVGDLAVGRKIRTLAENFLGRVQAYDAALESNAPETALDEALARNVYEDPQAARAEALSAYVRDAAAVDAGRIESLLAGKAVFPQPAAVAGGDSA